MGDIDQRFQRYLKNVPVMPDVATKIMSMADDRLDISFKELENVIKVDPGLSAKILKIANSALYARQREITNIQSAITLLGFENLKSLVLLVTASNLLIDHHHRTFYRRFWSHSVHAAFMSRHMCLRSGLKEEAEEAFTCALLHDIGQVALYNTDPDRYSELLASPSASRYSQGAAPSLIEAERSSFGIDHRELGASVFESWYFPRAFVEVAREHGNRNIVSARKNMILIVSLADIITDLLALGFGPGDEQQLAVLLPVSPLAVRDIDYYRTDHLADVRGDALFQQCRELFGIE